MMHHMQNHWQINLDLIIKKCDKARHRKFDRKTYMALR